MNMIAPTQQEVILADVVERIARLAAEEVPIKQIAVVIGVEEAKISDVQNTEGYKTFLAQLLSERFDEMQTVNDGWDAVEMHAIATVSKHLQFTHDADYALRAAAVANKAQRRGNLQRDRPIDGSLGARTVIYLNPTFVQQLNQMSMVNTVQQEKKQHDYLAPAKVQDVLSITENATEAETELLPNFDMAKING